MSFSETLPPAEQFRLALICYEAVISKTFVLQSSVCQQASHKHHTDMSSKHVPIDLQELNQTENLAAGKG